MLLQGHGYLKNMLLIGEISYLTESLYIPGLGQHNTFRDAERNVKDG
jgi:hypothetical protein